MARGTPSAFFLVPQNPLGKHFEYDHTLKFVYGDEVIGEDDVCLTGSNNMEHNVYPARCDEKHQDWKIKRV